MISPETISEESIIFEFPCLITWALILAISFKLVKALLALFSCKKPTIIFKKTAPKITMASVYSLKNKTTIPAIRRI